MTPRVGARLLLAAAVAAVVAALIAGILAVGPPSLEREKRLDEIRVTDLAAIENLISSFAKVHKGLPQDLAALEREPGYATPPIDPESGNPYEYEVLSADGYRLCAHFSARSTPESAAYIYHPANTWSHGAGNQCFNRRVDFGTGDHPQ